MRNQDLTLPIATSAMGGTSRFPFLTRQTSRSRMIRVRPLAAFDRRFFPSPRQDFLANWLSADGHVVRVAWDGPDIVGYGLIRPCRAGWKVGPLFADRPDVAQRLSHALISQVTHAGPAEIFVDTPEPNQEAVTLAENLALSPVFETARMYADPQPRVDMSGIFGVTTFELG